MVLRHPGPGRSGPRRPGQHFKRHWGPDNSNFRHILKKVSEIRTVLKPNSYRVSETHSTLDYTHLLYYHFSLGYVKPSKGTLVKNFTGTPVILSYCLVFGHSRNVHQTVMYLKTGQKGLKGANPKS